ncbi:MAG: hypothetical protein NTV49_14530 [Kiritimatiellaeota bacterium]|nr:hypothetical protein [Kiritimatiellota bacterium]
MLSFKTPLLVVSLFWAAAAAAETSSNLCYNGSFNSTNGPLDGWNVNYEWMGNQNFMKNHEACTMLPSYKGKSNVLWVNPGTQARVESKPIPIEKGVRYKCTMDLIADDSRFYFKCYKWEPGIAPHPDPHLSELRRTYKSEAYTGGSGGGGWKTVSFYLPMEEISELAWQHYKDVRFATIYMCRYRGGWYVTNVRVEKIPGTYKVVKTPSPKPAVGGRTPTPVRKPAGPKVAPKPSIIEADNEE